MKLVLASGSKTRKTVLEKLQLPFTTIPPNVDESPREHESADQLVVRLSVAKAQCVKAQFSNHLIIGSDQVAVIDDRIIGKPNSRDNAIQQLQAASENLVTLHTGITLLNSKTENMQTDVLHYQVQFRKLTQAMIEDYIDRDRPYDCGGSLRSEGLGIALLKKFHGDDPNILLGLPLIRLIDMLVNEGVTVLHE